MSNIHSPRSDSDMGDNLEEKCKQEKDPAQPDASTLDGGQTQAHIPFDPELMETIQVGREILRQFEQETDERYVSSEELVMFEMSLTSDQRENVAKQLALYFKEYINNGSPISEKQKEQAERAVLKHFYLIVKEARRFIAENHFILVPSEKMRKAESGVFVIFTEMGSVHYFLLENNSLDGPRQCADYYRESYYKIGEAPKHRLNTCKIKRPATVNFLPLKKSDQRLYIEYIEGCLRKNLKTSKIVEIYTSKDNPEAIMRSLTAMTQSIYFSHAECTDSVKFILEKSQSTDEQ